MKCRDEDNTWSVSKSATFAQCPRKFFLTYNVIRPSRMRGGQYSAYTLGGIAFHEAISEQIGRWARGNRINIDSAKERAKRFIDYCFNNPDKTIIEIINGFNLPEKFSEVTLTKTLKNLDNFYLYIWPRFINHRYVAHERLEGFKVGEADVLVKIDLCTLDNEGRLVITDWKTGLSSSTEDYYWQMGTYALWANLVRKEPPSNILLQIVNARRCTFELMEPIEHDYYTVTERITSEIAYWRTNLVMDQYNPMPDRHNCSGCPYVLDCTEGMKLVEADIHDCPSEF